MATTYLIRSGGMFQFASYEIRGKSLVAVHCLQCDVAYVKEAEMTIEKVAIPIPPHFRSCGCGSVH